jgi:hypothetical protein
VARKRRTVGYLILVVTVAAIAIVAYLDQPGGVLNPYVASFSSVVWEEPGQGTCYGQPGGCYTTIGSTPGFTIRGAGQSTVSIRLVNNQSTDETVGSAALGCSPASAQQFTSETGISIVSTNLPAYLLWDSSGTVSVTVGFSPQGHGVGGLLSICLSGE